MANLTKSIGAKINSNLPNFIATGQVKFKLCRAIIRVFYAKFN